MSNHFLKLSKCFLDYREYGISLNLKKCAFMVCFRTIIGSIISKKGKTHDPQGSNQDANTQNPLGNSSVQWNGVVLHMFHQKNCLYHGINYQIIQEIEIFEWTTKCLITWEDIKN
jgi:hypothetical protein